MKKKKSIWNIFSNDDEEKSLEETIVHDVVNIFLPFDSIGNKDASKERKRKKKEEDDRIFEEMNDWMDEEEWWEEDNS